MHRVFKKGLRQISMWFRPEVVRSVPEEYFVKYSSLEGTGIGFSLCCDIYSYLTIRN